MFEGLKWSGEKGLIGKKSFLLIKIICQHIFYKSS